eukprot:4936531-Pleurochrysis_carterae.AAC.1
MSGSTVKEGLAALEALSTARPRECHRVCIAKSNRIAIKQRCIHRTCLPPPPCIGYVPRFVDSKESTPRLHPASTAQLLPPLLPCLLSSLSPLNLLLCLSLNLLATSLALSRGPSL